MDDRLAKRLLATFRGELAEHVRALGQGLLALEKDPGGAGEPERLKSVFRAAHSLKGAARAVGLRPIEELCHELEGALRGLQEGTLAASGELFTVLGRAVDALDDAGRRLAAGSPLAGGPVSEATPPLAAVVRRLRRDAPPGRAPSPPAPSPPTASPPTASPPASPPAPTAPARPPPAPAPAPAPQATRASPQTAGGADALVRVPAAKLDLLLARSGELLVAERRLEPVEAGVDALGDVLARLSRDWRQARKERRLAPDAARARTERGGGLPSLEARLRAARSDLDRIGAALKEDRRAIGRAAAAMDEEVRRARMLPFADACEALERTALDVARERGKAVDVVVEGAAIEVDRSILEGLKDALVCLVRNAADHGIEAPEERRRAGKPPRGRIVVAAAPRGATVEVSVRDDGAGVDLSRVREAARRRGLPEPRDERDGIRLLFEPGFSTAERLTEISGRGVGLDIVKTRAESMHGSVELTFERGLWTRVAVTLPVTLTTMRVVLVTAGGETFAVPAASVERVVRVAPAEVRTAAGRDVLTLGDGPPVPLATLARLLSLPERAAARAPAKIVAVVVRAEGRAALAVDDVIAEREVLVKALGARLRRLRGFAGATILETGRVALILGAADLVRAAADRPGEALAREPLAEGAKRRRIVLADDSATTRSLERAILEAAGYEVLPAVDGEEAWRLVQERGPDLVVSDVDMPRMNGIALCKAVRASKRFRDLPFVLVTALDGEQDRARGGEAGADAYIVKSGFDQRDLVRTVADLLGGRAVIRVLVAEDSDTAREVLLAILGSAPAVMTVVGEARNGVEAVEMTKRLRPDVVTMDIRMPVLDGFEATHRIMIEAPTPVVVISACEAGEVATSLDAMRAGALMVLEKPAGPAVPGFEERRARIVEAVRLMAGVKVVRRFPERRPVTAPLPPGDAPARRDAARCVCVAASTGGPAAVQVILARLGRDFPAPVLIVQHIAKGFVGGFASWLAAATSFRVKIAEADEPLSPGVAYIAPDDRHLGVTRAGRVSLSAAPEVDGFRPSATALFESAAQELGRSVVAVILTGMGRDGVEGLRRVREQGGRILAQDEASTVVYGMPRAAVEEGLADEVLPLASMAARLTELVSRGGER